MLDEIVVGLRLLESLTQFERLLVLASLYEVAAEQIGRHGRRRIGLDELLGLGLDGLFAHALRLLAKLGVEFVALASAHIDVLEARGVALKLYCLARS